MPVILNMSGVTAIPPEARIITEDRTTKKYGLILVLTLTLLLAAAAGAEEIASDEHTDAHQVTDRLHAEPVIRMTDSVDTHTVVSSYDLYCLDCQRVIEENYRTEEAQEAHVWDIQREEPACESAGKETRVCALCGAKVTEEIPALGHLFADESLLSGRGTGPVLGSGRYAGVVIGTVDTEPSCTKPGRGTLLCVRCERPVSVPLLPTGEHKWGDWELVIVPDDMLCETEVTFVHRCLDCGLEETKVTAPAPGHRWAESESTEATCTEPGRTVRECTVCHKQETIETPALGHLYADAAVLAGRDAGEVMGEGANTGKVLGRIAAPSTCTSPGSGTLLCVRCQNAVQEVRIPLREHQWSEWETLPVPEGEKCVADVKGTHHCLDCGFEETKVLETAPGHYWEPVSYEEPTCTAPGRAERRCTVCGKVDVIETPPLGHCYMWIDSPEAASGDGTSQYVCTICGDVADERTVHHARMFYNNTITSYGPMIRDLLGGNVWNRVTAIDLSEDGMFTYPLIAGNMYTVGTATVVIDKGIQVVTYRLSSKKVNVHSESLVIYPDLEALRTGERALPFSFGSPIILADYFEEDARVIVAITLKADYDAADPSIQSFIEDQEQINAMIELIAPELLESENGDIE